MMRNLEKHKKYKTAYKPNDFYWGLGVEHETYIETSKLKQITLKELKENRASERYCVSYYNIYNIETLNNTLDGLFEADSKILVPILLNSHTFQKTDINGEHTTTYERVPKPNPNFSGKTLFEWLKQQNPDVFAHDYDKSYIFDGDTIEFMTQNFYKAKVQDVIDELTTIERDFMRAFNSLPREGILKTYGPFQLAQKNYPFASYLTNLKNNAMFNNGTIHINITLPTKLNEKGDVADMELFTKQHQNYARGIQWISPLIVAKYGAYDPLCESKVNGEKYAAGSQRVAVSRYIGLGTYDTDKMEPGKILTRARNKLDNLDWYESFHEKVDYKYLNELGMDLNFNKHFSHGLEFRILESIPMTDIYDILVMLVYLADFSLDNRIDDPRKSKLWHRITEKCVHDGKGYYMDVSDQNELYSLFGLSYLSKEPISAPEVFGIIVEHLTDKYKDATCAKYMIHGDDTPKPVIHTTAPPSLPSIPEVPSITPDITPDSTPNNKEINDIIKPSEIRSVSKIDVELKGSVPVAPKSKSIWCC
jgi:hypothetical protein